jgi:short-subunit dehydrogenase
MTAHQPRVVLITGASAGIGRETALEFARRGDKVAATARRIDRLEELTNTARDQNLPGEILPIAADVTTPADMNRAVDEIMVKWGRLDVLIANAGLGQRGAIVESAWDDFDVVLRTNIDGVLHSIRAAVPAMRKSGGGHIVTLSSVLSMGTGPYCAVYSASKSAVNAIARGLRMELSGDNIWVTNVLLGQTHSEFAQARRGISGRVASKMPTMQPDYVARRIVATTTRRRRTITLRLYDYLIDYAGVFFPWIMDRVLLRFYKPRA